MIERRGRFAASDAPRLGGQPGGYLGNEARFMIRNICLQDMEAVLNIWLQASIQAHRFIDAKFWHSQLDAMRNVYLPASESHIFEREGKVCGFRSLNQNVLAALFVAPEHQGTGIGAQLLADAKIRRPTLELAVYSANVPARRFYERHGFVALREQRDEHTGHLETLMRWEA
ncbi:N-acetyltransferase [Pseudomonas sp. YJ42]|uniref:N-acetyltransferase n=1 Tax=Pseudomonas sp. YJ42 TaxID=3392115 RepID=UPI0039A3B5B4